jgi:hypothetical protein
MRRASSILRMMFTRILVVIVPNQENKKLNSLAARDPSRGRQRMHLARHW